MINFFKQWGQEAQNHKLATTQLPNLFMVIYKLKHYNELLNLLLVNIKLIVVILKLRYNFIRS